MKIGISHLVRAAAAAGLLVTTITGTASAKLSTCMAGPNGDYAACRSAARAGESRAARTAAVKACRANLKNQRQSCSASLRAGGPRPTYSTPVITCGTSTQTSISIEVCAGATGAPSGFSLQFETPAEFSANNGWPAVCCDPTTTTCSTDCSVTPGCNCDDPTIMCKASFSGNAQLSRYNLAANECVSVNVGEFLFDNGASTDCPDALVCGTQYVFRAFVHGDNSGNRSAYTADLRCPTVDCEHLNNCTFTQGFWKTHGPSPTGNNTDVWPVSSLTLGSVSYTDVQLQSILDTPATGNGLIALAHQLIAAKLNIANGADGSSIASTIGAADALIGGLVVPPVGTGHLSNSVTSAPISALTSYNEGLTGPGHCP